MPATPYVQVPVSSVSDHTALPEDPLTSRSQREPRLSETADPGRDIPSKSWPPMRDTLEISSVTAGEELEANALSDGGNFDLPEGPDMSISPAAAFLSSLSPIQSRPPPSDASGQTIAGYVLGATIGFGGFSTIKKASSPSGGIVAVKIVPHTAFDRLPSHEKARQRARLSHEARVWASLSHENILPLFDSSYTPEAMYLITLYCPAGSLFDILKREGTPALEQTDVGCMFRQIVKALQYMHETMGLVHGDIKLENVLIDESGVCRLADFGLTRRIGRDANHTSSDDEEEEEDCGAIDGRQETTTFNYDHARVRRSATIAQPGHVRRFRHEFQRHRYSEPEFSYTPPAVHKDDALHPGSLPYAAPELLLPHAYVAHPAQDMWALGVLLYILLTGSYPFCDPFMPRLQMKIIRGVYDLPAAIGPHAEAVLKGCLEKDVSDRWRINMVDDAAWGIGYGDIAPTPLVNNKQNSRSQSPSRLRSRSRSRLQPRSASRRGTPTNEDLAKTTPAGHSQSRSVPRGRKLVLGLDIEAEAGTHVRSQSRSSGPSMAPCTPEDERSVDPDDYFAERRGRKKGNSSVARFFIQADEEAGGDEWRARGAFYRERTDQEGDPGRMGVKELTEVVVENEVRGRQDGAPSKRGLLEVRRTSQSRTRSW